MATAKPKTRTRITKAQIEKARETNARAKKPQPSIWTGSESWTGTQFTRAFQSEMRHYNLAYSSKDLKPKIIDWMGRNGYDRADISLFKKTKDWRCGVTMGAVASCLLKGMPESHPEFNKGRNSADWLRKEIQRVILEGTDDVEPLETVKAKKVEVSIQDRIRDQAAAMSEELDLAVDSWMMDPETFDPKDFKVSSLLRTKGAKAAHARYVRGFYEKNLADLQELASGAADDQLKENYRAYPRKHVRKLIEFYESIMTACEQIAAEAKVLKKPRAKKVKPVEELVKNLKFKVSDDKLGITSVPPAQLIGAQSAVVYNSKMRKIGYYIAKTSAGLAVKGSSVINFTEKSVQKTLRNPAQALKEFKEQNTQRRVEQWFDKSVKTTATALNGRFNPDVVILKVFK